MKFMTNKLQPLPCKIPKRISVRCSDYLIILLLHGRFINYDCLFKFQVTVAWIILVVFQAKLKPNLIQYYTFSKNIWMWHRTLNKNLINYKPTLIDLILFVSLLSWLVYTTITVPQKLSTHTFYLKFCFQWNICPKNKKGKRYLSQKQINL